MSGKTAFAVDLAAWTFALLIPAATLRGQSEAGVAQRASLRTVEGKILSLAEQSGEGALAVVTATLEAGGEPGELQVLLAPASVLEETGFEIAEGDDLRVRIFLSEEGPARAQKVRNLTRQTMIRLRTLHQVPLWDSIGRWQGGPGPMPGGRGGAHGGHRGPPR